MSQFGRQGIQFVTTAILAHLLSPSDYGLLGMATVVTGFLGVFSDLGTSSSLIQKQEVSNELLSTIFWFNVFFGLLIMLIIYMVSPLAAIFFHEQRVVPILRVLSITFLFASSFSVHSTILQRNLGFDVIAKIELVSSILASAVGITCAFMGFGVWSLVYQSLTVFAICLVMYWYLSKWRPAILFHFSEIKSVYSYSANLVGFNILNYFNRNADYLLIGHYLGAQALGYYTLAYRLMLYPLQSVSGVLGRVLFPAFSRIQEDVVRFRNSYLKVNSAIAMVTFPMMFGLWAVADHFVLAALGPKWEPVIVLLLILVPVGMVQSIVTNVGLIYQARGRTDWLFRWGIASCAVVLTAFFIGVRWGIVGVATSYSLATLVLLYPNFAIPFKLINLDFTSFLRSLWKPFFCGAFMFVALMSFRLALPAGIAHIVALMLLIPAGLLVYFLGSWLINREDLIEFSGLIGARK